MCVCISLSLSLSLSLLIHTHTHTHRERELTLRLVQSNKPHPLRSSGRLAAPLRSLSLSLYICVCIYPSISFFLSPYTYVYRESSLYVWLIVINGLTRIINHIRAESPFSSQLRTQVYLYNYLTLFLSLSIYIYIYIYIYTYIYIYRERESSLHIWLIVINYIRAESQFAPQLPP